MLFPSQDGSQAGVLIDRYLHQRYPARDTSNPPTTPFLSDSPVLTSGVSGRGPEPMLLLPLHPLPPWPSPSPLRPRCLLQCRAPAWSGLALPGRCLCRIPQRSGAKPASGLGSLFQVWACSPAPAIPTPAPSPFPRLLLTISPLLPQQFYNPFTPESGRKRESNLAPARAAGDLGSLRALEPAALKAGPGTGAACPVRLLWLVFNLQESHWAETGSSAARAHPNRALHWCCWCLRKASTRDREHEGFGVWQEPGGQFPRLIL